MGSKVKEKRTITIQHVRNNNEHKIFDSMCHISKNICNISIYILEFMDCRSNYIYKKMYEHILDKKIIDVDFFNKNVKKFFSDDLVEYKKMCIHKKNNNDIIYKFISEKLKNKVLNNSNFSSTHYEILNELLQNKNIYIPKDETYIEILFRKIVFDIMKSFYNYKFFLLKHEIKNNIPFTLKTKPNGTKYIDDPDFRRLYADVKLNKIYEFRLLLKFDPIQQQLFNKKILFTNNNNDEKINYKDKIKEYLFKIKYPNNDPNDVKNYQNLTKKEEKEKRKELNEGKKKFMKDNFISNETIHVHLCMENLGENYLINNVICNIIKKSYENRKSFYKLKENGQKNAQKQKYLPKDGKFNLSFTMDYGAIIENGKIRLSLGKYVTDNYPEIINKKLIKMNTKKYDVLYAYENDVIIIEKKDSKKYKTEEYCKINHPNDIGKMYCVERIKLIKSGYMYIDIPKKISGKKINNKEIKGNKITQIEIVPIMQNLDYKICITYEIEGIKQNKTEEIKKNGIEESKQNGTDKINKNEIGKIKQKDVINKVEDMISIDIGVKRLITIYDPSGDQRTVNGGFMIHLINIMKKTSELQSEIDKCNNDERKKKLNWRKQKTENDRQNKLNDYLNRLVNWILEIYSKKKLIIIGYNKQWKKNGNLYTKNLTRIFQLIPFSRFIKKLKRKGEEKGIQVETINESYTSICDSLALEEVKRHEKYKGERKSGLFYSSTNKIINADLNGSINIMRKYLAWKGINFNEVTGKNIFNPVKIIYNKESQKFTEKTTDKEKKSMIKMKNKMKQVIKTKDKIVMIHRKMEKQKKDLCKRISASNNML